jgi:hypothetical protein
VCIFIYIGNGEKRADAAAVAAAKGVAMGRRGGGEGKKKKTVTTVEWVCERMRGGETKGMRKKEFPGF